MVRGDGTCRRKPRVTRREPSPCSSSGQRLYLPGLLPGRTSDRSGQGPGLDRAGRLCRRPRTGPATEACPPRTMSTTSASSTTSRWCVCSSRSTGHVRTTGGLDEALRLLDRLAEAAENRTRRKSPRDPHAAGPRTRRTGTSTAGRSTRLTEPGSVVPEPDGYMRLFLDEGEPMIGLLADAEQQGIAGDHAGRLLRLAASKAVVPSSAAARRQGRRPPS